jgi:hypothetical protein
MRAILFNLIFLLLAGATIPSRGEDSSTNEEQIIPRVSFTRVPITIAIKNLARQAGINYQIDTRCSAALTGSVSSGIPEELVTLDVTNVSARGLMVRMLTLRGFVLTNDPVSNVATITLPGLPARSVDYQLLDLGKIYPLEYVTNCVIPLISFNAVPMDVGLQHLAREVGPDISIDPGFADALYPELNFRWQKLTAKQALVALCRNYGLLIVKGDVPGTVVIKPGPEGMDRNH